MSQNQADVTLCRLAAIAISKHLWKHSHLEDVLKSCIKNDAESGDVMPSAIKSVTDELILPEGAREELMCAVGIMGSQIWELRQRLRQNYEGMILEDSLFMPKASLDYVCWEIDGFIDLPNTMRSFYYAGKLRENYATWEDLCMCCLEDCINDLWTKIGGMDRYNDWRTEHSVYQHDEFTRILTAYWAACVNNNMENVINDAFRPSPHQFYDDNYSTEENMFIHLFAYKKYWAVKYFWGSFDENQRRRTISKISENIMSDNPSMQEYKDLFFTSDALRCRMMIFFLKQLSYYRLDDIRIEILGSGIVLGTLLLWPHNNLFMETLKESSLHHDSIDYGPMISHLLWIVCHCKEFEFIDRDVVYRRIFYRIWEMNPPNLKISIDYGEILTMLWQSKEVELLNHILRDEELKNRREEFLIELAMTYDRNEIQIEFFVKFLKKVLISEEEQLWFSRQIDSALKEADEETDVEDEEMDEEDEEMDEDI